MAYKSLYNKYRPMSFEEVAGQGVIVRTLRNAIATDKIAHAYLFCGPRGTGKTTMARLLAKALNCEEGIGHQCNQCSNCLALNAGSHPDVIEIDAASNNGVDQVRDLIEQVRYSPMKGRYKVYIIDEVHMMSQGAFNALLKTLEEPPEHVVFILATTEPHKVLPTIFSRCQRYDFSKIDDRDIRSRLTLVLQKEGVAYEEEALSSIVELADGGMRDALSILDQVLAYGGSTLKASDVLSVFGLTSTSEKIALLQMVCKGDVPSVLSKFEEFLSGGVDIKRLCASLLDILKDLLIYKKTKDASLLSVLKKNEVESLAPLLKGKEINEMIGVLLKTQIDFKSVSNIRSLFELTLLQLCGSFGDNPLEEEPAEQPAPKPMLGEPKAKPLEAPALVVEPKIESKTVEQEAPKQEVKPAEQPYNPDSGTPYTGTEIPSFLDEEEPTSPVPAPAAQPAADPAKQEAPIESTSSSPAEERPLEPLSEEGDSYALDPKQVLNIMVLSQKFKAERGILASKWPTLNEMKFDPHLGEAAALLSNGSPICLCDEALLLKYVSNRQKERLNLKANQARIAEIIETFLGRKVFVYAVNASEFSSGYKTFTAYVQLGTLPKPETIVLELPKGE